MKMSHIFISSLNKEYTNIDISLTTSKASPRICINPFFAFATSTMDYHVTEKSSNKLIVAETQAHNPNRNSNTNQQIITDRS